MPPRALREREQERALHLPFIALTANPMKEDETRCLASGMDDYLSKAIQKELLEPAIAKWFGRRRSA